MEAGGLTMVKTIEMLSAYQWYGEPLLESQVYEVGKQYNGHLLDEKNAIRLIEEGWARQVE